MSKVVFPRISILGLGDNSCLTLQTVKETLKVIILSPPTSVRITLKYSVQFENCCHNTWMSGIINSNCFMHNSISCHGSNSRLQVHFCLDASSSSISIRLLFHLGHEFFMSEYYPRNNVYLYFSDHNASHLMK